MSGIEKLQIDHAQILYILDLGLKILLILPKYHEKTLSDPGAIKIFRPGRRMYIIYTSSIPGRNIKQRKTVGNFLGENFPRTLINIVMC